MYGLSDVAGQFLSYLLAERRVARNTFLAYKKDVEQFDEYLVNSKVKLHSLTKKNITAFLKVLRDQKISAKSLARKVSSLKHLFNFLSQSYGLPNLAKTIVFPKVEKTLPTYLTEQEIARLLEAANQDTSNKGVRNKVMLYLMYATGMRVSELVSLTIEQLHFDTGFVNVLGKGNKERMIPLPKNLIELLSFYVNHIYPQLHQQKNSQTHVKKVTYLFAANYNNELKPLSRQSFWIHLKKVLIKAEILKNISPHSLRHSLATHLLQKGADLRSLQMLLGHQNLSTVQVYTHLGNTQLRKTYDKKHPRA